MENVSLLPAIRNLDSLLKPTSEFMPGPDVPRYQASQQSWWRELLRPLQESVGASGYGQSLHMHLKGKLEAGLQTFTQQTSVVNNTQAIKVTGPLPSIRSRPSIEDIEAVRASMGHFVDWLVLRCWDYLADEADPLIIRLLINAPTTLVAQEVLQPAIRAEMIMKAMGLGLVWLREQVTNIDRMSEAYENSLRSTEEIDARVKDVQEKIGAKAGEQIEHIRMEIASAAKFAAHTDSARQLWAQTARQHSISFWFFGIMFVAGLFGSVASLILGIPVYWREIQTLQPDTLRVAAVAVPILAAAWFLRFALRLSMQSLSNRDDARMRAAQVETYLRLVAQGEKEALTKEERALALNALFRPPAGQEGAEISPIIWLDALKDAAKAIAQKT